MKISKLFHWLYAILMFLPILVFIPNAFYYGFNEHSVAQEKTEQVPVYYQTNEVNGIDDLIVGNVYTINIDVRTDSYNDFILLCKTIFYYQSTAMNYRGTSQYAIPPYVFFYTDGGQKYIIINDYANNTNNNYNLFGKITIDLVLNNNSLEVLNKLLPFASVCNTNYIKEYQPLTTNMSITDSMSYAWKSTWQNELFSWSYDSFLTQPFLYITNLFNVPATNTLLYCLSYWLNISIIWLCFDVVMYVPLLVHRWLDKGIIE